MEKSANRNERINQARQKENKRTRTKVRRYQRRNDGARRR